MRGQKRPARDQNVSDASDVVAPEHRRGARPVNEADPDAISAAPAATSTPGTKSKPTAALAHDGEQEVLLDATEDDIEVVKVVTNTTILSTINIYSNYFIYYR